MENTNYRNALPPQEVEAQRLDKLKEPGNIPSTIPRRRFLQIITAASALELLNGCSSDDTGRVAARGAEGNLRTAPKTPSSPDAEVPKGPAIKVHKEVKELINNETFGKGRFAAFAGTFERILGSQFGKAFYFTLDGKICAEVPIPKKGDKISWTDNKTEKVEENWPLHKKSSKYWTKEKKQDWHNLNRKEHAPKEGVVLPTYEKLGYPFVSVPYTNDGRFEGNSYAAVAKARLEKEHKDDRYFKGEEKSLSEAIAIIANEYGLPVDLILAVGAQESTFYKYRVSDRGAKGIFQLMDETAEDALKLVKSNPSFREGKIDLKKDRYNRFVQIELFCRYYLFIKKLISRKVKALERRIKKLDPSFNTDLEEIAIVNAYNAGPGKIRQCIDKFLRLKNPQIKKLIGKPPYDSNVWMGVVGNSYGQNAVGKDVFFYAPKVMAWRELLKDEVEETATPPDYEKYSKDIIPKAKKELDKQFKKLKKGNHKFTRFTKKEWRTVKGKDVKMPGQIDLLRNVFSQFVPKRYFKSRSGRLLSGSQRRRKIRSCKRSRRCFDGLNEKQSEWKKKQIKAGNLVKMKEDDGKKPYFCQQVGKNSGTSNSKEALYMDKEFEPLLTALVELVNYQIDKFNNDPERYGVKGLEGKKIPQISAIKISGAFRSLEHQYKKLTHASKTSDFSSHLTGHALDIGALQPIHKDDAAVVRFKKAFKVNGEEKIPKGGKLYTSGFGEQTRLVISKMIGRALISMTKLLKNLDDI